MMTPDLVQWVVGQGVGAVLALVMFLIWRKDSKQNATDIKVLAEKYAFQQAESAAAWMAHGKELGQLMARTAGALERIEARMESTTTCPVTHVTAEMLRESATAPDGGRRRMDVLMRQAWQRAASDADDARESR